MKYLRITAPNRGAKIVSPGRTDIHPVVFLRTAKESGYPFVDKTRTMTGRVSENI